MALALGALRITAVVRETPTSAELRPGQGQMVKTDIGAIYVEAIGDPSGAPDLLANGTAAWSRLWAPTASALAGAGYYAIALAPAPGTAA